MHNVSAYFIIFCSFISVTYTTLNKLRASFFYIWCCYWRCQCLKVFIRNISGISEVYFTLSSADSNIIPNMYHTWYFLDVLFDLFVFVTFLFRNAVALKFVFWEYIIWCVYTVYLFIVFILFLWLMTLLCYDVKKMIDICPYLSMSALLLFLCSWCSL